MKKLLLISCLVITVIGLIFGGCASPEESKTSTAQPESTISPTSTLTPVTGGTLKRFWHALATPIGWPPSYATMVKDVKRNLDMVQNLWYMDINHELQPVLAESWDFAPDNKSITFYLRKGVKFHDGTDWNAQAAKFMFDEYVKNKNVGSNTWSSIEVINDYTLRIDFTVVTSLEPYYIANVCFISPTAYQELGPEGILWNPVGTGPFKFKEYQQDVLLVEERFEDYWGDKPYLDAVEFRYIADDSAQLAAMIAGDVHTLNSPNPAMLEEYKKRGFNVEQTKSPDEFVLTFDSANATSPFANIKVRQAVNYALDREGYCEAMGYGYWSPESQIIPSDSWGYNNDLAPYKRDVAKAKQLLDEAGYTNGFNTELLVANTFNQSLFTAVQADLKEVGINVELNLVDIGTFVGMNYVTGWSGMSVGIIEQLDPLYSIAQRFTVTDGKTRYVNLKVPEGIQPLLDEAQATYDFDTQKSLMQQIAKIAYDEAMVAPIVTNREAQVTMPGLHDFHFYPTPTCDWWDPCQVWLDESLH